MTVAFHDEGAFFCPHHHGHTHYFPVTATGSFPIFTGFPSCVLLKMQHPILGGPAIDRFKKNNNGRGKK